MGLNEYDYSSDELLGAATVTPYPSNNKISMAKALNDISELAETDSIFKGDCDGLDALCYHLDGYTVDKAIRSLKKVKERFARLESKE